ncbi:MAG TPA: hypothetical protein VFL57_03395 [Bryobacteraceae bacterium]|nr:hypothetical protein [Bryobacteraceae bacterium]
MSDTTLGSFGKIVLSGGSDGCRTGVRLRRSCKSWLLEEYEKGRPVDEASRTELRRAGAEAAFATLANYFGANAPADAKIAATWMHIAELWDYTPQPEWCEAPIPEVR